MLGVALSAALVNRVFADDDQVGTCYSQAHAASREQFIRDSYAIEPLTLKTGQRVLILNARTECLCAAQNCPVLAYAQQGTQYQLAFSAPAISARFDTNGNGVVSSHDSALVSVRETLRFRSSRYETVKSEIVNNETGEAKPSEIPVHFAPGASASNVRGHVVMGFPDTYVVTAKSGQRLRVALSPRNSNAEVYVTRGNSGQPLAAPSHDWSGTLPAGGDYQIVVDGTSETSAQYALTIAIDPASSSPSWTRPNPGTKAFVGALEGDVAEAGLCPTTTMYPRTLYDNTTSGCAAVPSGLAVTILSVKRVRGDYGWYGRDLLVAKVRATEGHASGYIALQLLNPAVPSGTDVTLRHDSGGPIKLAPAASDEYGGGLTLSDGTHAKVVRYDPKSDGHDLLVRITSGPHAGKTGWVYAYNAFLPDGTPIVSFQQ